MKKTNYDTVIIGGGIIGLFTAWELQKAGQSVCVLERGEFGREASWAAGGILSPLRPWNYPLEVNELALESQAQYQSICQELQSISGIDCEWRRSGMLILDCPEYERAQAWANESHQRLELLEGSDLDSRFPGIERGHDSAPSVWLPDVAQVRNPRLLKALLKSLEGQGVVLSGQEPVRELYIEESQVRGVITAISRITAAQVVVCAGAWSSDFLPTLAQDNQVYPVKGQMLLLGPVQNAPHSITMRGDRYIVPRADGRILVGSTTEDVGFDKWTDDETLEDLRRSAIAMCPTLAEAKVEAQWSGLRPATPDERPLIGRDQDIRGLHINTGHYRSGIVMAPASARHVSASILAE